jgi:lysozyme family protein
MEIEKLALEKYPKQFPYDDDWDSNAQYRDEWIEGVKFAQKELYTKEDIYNCLGDFAYKYGIIIDGRDLTKWLKDRKL